MSNLIITFPNPTGFGLKTHTVTTTPSTLLTEVISQVVIKHGLGDPLAFGLRNKKNTLDSSLSMRFANLAPGTKLELITVAKEIKGQSHVTVALQLENGQRIVEKFLARTTFWDMLLLFSSQHPSTFEKSPTEQITDTGWITPVFQILNREILGLTQLRETSLQSLGITSGNILTRLSFRPSQVAYSEICTQIQEASTNSQVFPIEAPKPKIKPVLEAQVSAIANTTADIKTSVVDEKETIDRGIQVLRVAESDVPLSERIDLPDSHFELSASELKLAISRQQSHTRQLIEGAPLKTKAMVEKEKKRWLEQHPTCTIRVRLPDATQLQATFKSLEPISALGQVIRSSLHDSSRQFVLSQAPPYRKIDPDSDHTFYSLGLVPSAQIHLRFSESTPDVPILTESLSARAEYLPLPSLPNVSSKEPSTLTSVDDSLKEKFQNPEPKVDSAFSGKSKIPKWLKLSK